MKTITYALFSLLLGNSAWAATLVVTNTTDLGIPGDGSLRGEIAAASNGDTIDATGVSGTITLLSPLQVNSSVTINGPSSGGLAVSGGGAVQVMHIGSAATVQINYLTIENGFLSSNFLAGAGIYNQGTLTLNYCTVSGNSEALTAGDFNSVHLEGGGIYNQGTLTLNNSTVSGNSITGTAGADGEVNVLGGGIYNESTLTLNNSTVSGNSATSTAGADGFPDAAGGGIFNSAGTLTLANTTVSANSAFGSGGFGSGGAGGGIEGTGGTFNLRNSIIAGNTAVAGPDYLGTVITSNGHNFVGNWSSAVGLIVGQDQSGNPKLGALAPNGGPTQTHALLSGSTAIDAGLDADAPGSLDQRGFARTSGPHVDIGAFEVQYPVALCQGVIVQTAPNTCGAASASINNNSYDPDPTGTISLMQTPAGPYNLGSTSVMLTVTDTTSGLASSCSASVMVSDATLPAISCPANVTTGLQCFNNLPANGTPSFSDNCAGASLSGPIQGASNGTSSCNNTITRTWTATDSSNNSNSCTQTLFVNNTGASTTACNNPATMTPSQAPICFKATTTDSCGAAIVPSIGAAFTCMRNGKNVNECRVTINKDTICITNSGGNSDTIGWTVNSTDACGNPSTKSCSINVVGK